MRLKTILLAIVVVAVSFFVSLKAMDWLSPRGTVRAPALVELPPLPPAPRSSTVIAPVAIALTAIRDAADRGTPRSFGGKADNPVSQILQNADIGWTASRGPISASGAQDVLSLATPLTGTLNVTGSLSLEGDRRGRRRARRPARRQRRQADRQRQHQEPQRQRRDQGQRHHHVAAETGRGLAHRAEFGRAGEFGRHQPFGGGRARQRSGAGQAADRQERRRADRDSAGPDPQRSRARAERAGAMGQGLPLDPAARHRRDLVAAGALAGVAADPRDRRTAARRCFRCHLTLGIEAETRITPAQTKPDCPFPATIAIVPPTPGGVSIGVPIDMPFTDINKIVEAQFAGKTFPEDGSGSVDVTVKRATVAASGDRLLISLLVNAKEKKSFFGFGGEANVHIWGKPVLDQAQQTLRLTEIELAVESEAAFGLLGAAARAAMPHLQKALADKATIDLKPFATNAQKKIAAAIADFQKNEDGVRVAAEITSLRLADIAFDSKTLRVIAEAEGAINVFVTALPGL